MSVASTAGAFCPGLRALLLSAVVLGILAAPQDAAGADAFCCLHGDLVRMPASACLEQGGLPYDDHATAQRLCRMRDTAPVPVRPMEPQRTAPAPSRPLEPPRTAPPPGRPAEPQRAAPPPPPPRPPETHLPASESGFCCLRGEVFPAPHPACVEEGGAFFPDAESAARACAAGMDTPPVEEPGFCCLHGDVFPAPHHACSAEGGAFFPDEESAAHTCATGRDVPPGEEPGFCCLRGEVVPAPHHACSAEDGAFFPDEESAVHHCAAGRGVPPGEEPGFCCLHGDVFPAPHHACNAEDGAFFPDAESAAHHCAAGRGAPPGEEPGFCCLRGEVVPAPHHACSAEGGAFFPDPESAEGACYAQVPRGEPLTGGPEPRRGDPEPPPTRIPRLPLVTARVVNEWVKTGGPIGGLGYDVRFGGNDTSLMYVTDNYSGVNRSVDGGASWHASNQGIHARTGSSGDAVPVFSLTVDPNDPRIVWAGMKDVLGIYKSTDRGQSWVDTTPGFLEGQEVVFRGFTVQPGNSQVVYAAAEIPTHDTGRGFDRVRGAVFRTEDGGTSWNGIWEGMNLARYVIVHPDDPDLLYVSLGIFDREAKDSRCKDLTTQMPGTPDFYEVHGSGGILKSTDRGATWKVLGPANGLTDLYVGSLVMHPTNPDVLLAGAGNNACSVYRVGGKPRFAGGVFRSEDAGASWSQTLADDNITSVEFAPSKPNVAYAGGRRRFYASRDSGRHWNVVAGHTHAWGPPGVIAGFPIDVLVDPGDPQTLFANNYGGGNVKSTDGGGTWTLASQGYTGALMHDVEIHPTNPDVVYAGARSGLFRSQDAGASWEGLSHPPAALAESYAVAIKPDQPNVVLASQEQLGTLYRSTNGGLAWKAVAHLPVQPGTSKGEHGFKRILFTKNPLHVYAGSANKSNKLDQYRTSHGIWKSVDGGLGWVKLRDPKIASVAVNDLAVDPMDVRVAYAATAGHGLFKTNDAGATWQALEGLRGPKEGVLKDVRSVAIRPDRPNTLYAGIELGGVYTSTDGGVSWTRLAAGMQPNDPIWALVVDPARPDVVWAGSHRTGVHFWDVNERRWIPFNRGLSTKAVVDLAISKDGLVLYATTTGEGVFRLQRTAQ